MTFKPSNPEIQTLKSEVHTLEMKNASENASNRALRELDDRVRLKELKGHGGGAGAKIHPDFRGEHDLRITDDHKSEEAARRKVGEVPERSEEKKMRDVINMQKLSTGKPDTDSCEVDKKGLTPKRNAEGNYEITTCGADGKTPAMRKTFDYDAKTVIGVTKWDKAGERNYSYEQGKLTTYEQVKPNRDSEIINYSSDGKTPVNSQKIDHTGKITMTSYIDGKRSSLEFH